MAIVYTWDCRAVTAYVDLVQSGNDYPDCVFKVNWILTGTEEYEGVLYTYTQSGQQEISTADLDPGTYVPFDQLTNEIATGWVTTAMGPEQVQIFEDYIASQINAKLGIVNLYIQGDTPTPPVVE